MKMSNEIKDDSFQYYGLSEKESKKYWQLQNRRLFNINRFFNIACISFGILLAPLSFSTKFKVNLFDYILYGTFHSINAYFYLDGLLTVLVNLHLFPFALSVFFCKKFEYLNMRLEKIANERTKKRNNLELKKLIWEFNCVIDEFLKANKYWKKFFGSSFFVAICVTTLVIFIYFFSSFEFRIVIVDTVLTVLPIMILFPYYQSTRILKNVNFFTLF